MYSRIRLFGNRCPACVRVRPFRTWAHDGNFSGKDQRFAIRKAAATAAVGVSAVAWAAIYITNSTQEQLHCESDRPLRPADYSQHTQVTSSIERPGVYIWGSNQLKVADPESDDVNVKIPRRFKAFDGQGLRDLALGDGLGVAVDDNGDLIQWGLRYWGDDATGSENQVAKTLQGKNIKKVVLTKNMVYALSENGSVFSLAHSKSEQGVKSQETNWSWFPSLWVQEIEIAYRKLPIRERIVDIAAGDAHVLFLTRGGGVLSTASDARGNDYGQMGILGEFGDLERLSQIHEVIKGGISKIAAGSAHSIALDKQGQVWSFGSNKYGQLGIDYSDVLASRATPGPVTFVGLYPRTMNVSCENIYASNYNTYLALKSSTMGFGEGPFNYELWACGSGINGQLGNNLYSQVQARPVRIRVISGLKEYDEKSKQVRPIKVDYITSGGGHTAAVLDVSTNTAAALHGAPGSTEVNYGKDAFIWGKNETYQLGNGKRYNMPTPQYMAALVPTTDNVDAMKSLNRLQLTPPRKIQLYNSDGSRSRRALVEQCIVAGHSNTAVYTKIQD